MNEIQWIWQTKAWPQLRYDQQAVTSAVFRARLAEAKLVGKAEAIGFAEMAISQRHIWTEDAIATAAIEGERLNVDVVRSSVARRLGLSNEHSPQVSRNVEGLLDAMEDATARSDSDLSHDRLCLWQAGLFQGDTYAALKGVAIGQYRARAEPMQIISGSVGKETVHYQAPPSAAVRAEMNQLIDWFNRTRHAPSDRNVVPENALDGIVRAGLAHLWFEVIHPFEDGNGRVGRVIIDMALAQDAKPPNLPLPYRLHGVSRELHRRHAEYYAALNAASRGDGDVSAWLLWFIDVFATSCDNVARLIDESLARARFWSDHREVALNERQRKALNKMLEAGPAQFEGGMTARKYVALTGVSPITATRDLTELSERGLLLRKGDGRSTYYNLSLDGWGWIPTPRANKIAP